MEERQISKYLANDHLSSTGFYLRDFITFIKPNLRFRFTSNFLSWNSFL